MDQKLLKLVHEYQARVAEAVAMLAEAGIEKPATNVAWAESDTPGKGALPGGFTFYVHGFGCVVDGPDWRVDFDFGENGEIDGFDASRLHGFARKRLGDYGFASEKEIEHAIQDAVGAGEVKFSGYILYYLV